MTNLFEIQTWIYVCRRQVGVCLALGFGGWFCFSAVLFACNVYPRSQGLFLLQESKLPEFWLQMFHILHPPLIFCLIRKLSCSVFVSKNWSYVQFFLQIFIFSSSICCYIIFATIAIFRTRLVNRC